MAAEPSARGQVGAVESTAAVLDDFMAAMPAVAFVKDSGGRYRYVNRQFLEQFGDQFGCDWLDKTDADVFPADTAALVHGSDVAALAADAPVQTTLLMPVGEASVPFLVTKFPIHTPQGVLLGGIGLDITHERALAAEAARHANERALIADMLANLPAQATSEATAQMICRQVVKLPGVVSASIMRFAQDDRAWPMGFALANGGSPGLLPIPVQRSRRLRERAAEGAWIEASAHRPSNPYSKMLNELGVRAHAYAPIRHAGKSIGLLAVGFALESDARELAESVPALVELAALAGVLFGPDLAGKAQSTYARQRIVEVLDGLAFHPVFQPIVDLDSREVVGYEALTRFDSGQRPDLCFADAWSVGLGPDLELVTLEAAVAASKGLPSGHWLDLNVSPRMLTDPEKLRPVPWGAERPIVIEITEHEIIADYGAVREAVLALGNDVRLAIDDAGAGIANFGHIIELRPDLVKLDISIVRGVNANLGRQAMAAGMRHFSRTAGCRLVAEGVETEAEAATLCGLGVEFGQGYLFGHPEPVEAWVETRTDD